MKLTGLITAFTLAAGVVSPSFAQNNEPAYLDAIQGFPNEIFYIEACSAESMQLKTVFWLATTDENLFASILGPDLFKKQQESGQDHWEYWSDFSVPEQDDMSNVFKNRLENFLEQNMDRVQQSVSNLTAKIDVEHRDMQMYGFPTIRDELPDLHQAVRVMSIDFAKAEGWNYINAGLLRTEITPNSLECNGTSSIKVEEIRMN